MRQKYIIILMLLLLTLGSSKLFSQKNALEWILNDLYTKMRSDIPSDRDTAWEEVQFLRNEVIKKQGIQPNMQMFLNSALTDDVYFQEKKDISLLFILNNTEYKVKYENLGNDYALYTTNILHNNTPDEAIESKKAYYQKRIYEKVDVIPPSYYQSLLNDLEGEYYLTLGEIEKAGAFFRLYENNYKPDWTPDIRNAEFVEKENPDVASLISQIDDLYLTEPDKALHLAKEAVAKFPHNSTLRHHLYNLYKEKGDFKNALSHYEAYRSADALHFYELEKKIYQQEREEKRKITQKAAEAMQANRSFWVVLFSLAVIVIAGFAYFYRRIRKANILIEKEKRIIENQKKIIEKEQKRAILAKEKAEQEAENAKLQQSIAEKLQTLAEILEKKRMIFFAKTSHEIKNWLNPIPLSVNLLEDYVHDSKKPF